MDYRASRICLRSRGQGWADCIWRDVNGWKERKKYEQYLKSTLDEVKNRNLTWGTIFHDWAIIKADPTAEIMRSFIQYAKENGIKLVSLWPVLRQETSV